jgi:apolipoprotein N-acyltransferase
LENRRWVLRVTNSGLTAAIDPYGRVYQTMPPDVRGSVDLPYDFRTDTTLYTRFGIGSLGCASLVSVILLANTFRKKNMILEDLQYRYEGLKQRISLVRSYL